MCVDQDPGSKCSSSHILALIPVGHMHVGRTHGGITDEGQRGLCRGLYKMWCALSRGQKWQHCAVYNDGALCRFQEAQHVRRAFICGVVLHAAVFMHCRPACQHHQ
jgi:hypothetical protein